MEVKSVSKYNKISAKKARLVADMVRNQNVQKAFGMLSFTPKKAAKLIAKTLKSAVANAEHNFHADKDKLVISKIMVDEGPTLKRFMPRAQGRAGRINKRTSHITIVLEGEEKADNKKEVKNASAKSLKKVSKIKEDSKIDKNLTKNSRSSRKVASDNPEKK